MAGGEPRLGTTATYMRHNDHGTTRPSTEIDRLHDRTDNEYRIFSAGSVRKWSKFGLKGRSPGRCSERRRSAGVRVQAICDYVRQHTAFGCEVARASGTA